MKKILTLVYLFLFFIFPHLTHAKVSYKVDNVVTEHTAKNATEAKKIAIEKGQRQALNILFERMKIDQSYVAWIADEEISQMVSSLRIDNEKISKTYYSATLNIEFSPDFVKFIFNKYSINNNAAAKNIYLAIPATIVDGRVFIWKEKKNLWFDNWKNYIEKMGIQGMIIPDKDIENLAAINEGLIIKGNYADFSNLLSLYKADSILIVISEYKKEEDKIHIMLTKITSSEEQNTIRLDYFNSEDANEKTLFKKAAEKTINYVIKTENRKNAKALSNQQTGMRIVAPISGIEEFLAIKSMLEEVEFIKKVELISITKRKAALHIDYDVDDELIAGMLENEGFHIKKRDDIYYIYSKWTYNLLRRNR